MESIVGKQTATLLQHLGEPKVSGDPVTPPITQTSLFVFDTVDELWAAQQEPFGPPYDYSRLANPTLHIAEQKIAHLEKTERCKLYGSGMGAISAAIMSCVEAGKHVVALDTCYGPTKQFLKDYLPQFGVSVTFVDGLTTESFLSAITPETSCVYLESPGSILFRPQDLRPITDYCRTKSITTIADNSYASPLYQQPASFGVDIVVHSATKYLAGHSDVCAGALCTSSERMRSIIQQETALFGAALGPFPAWLLLRALRTLHLRMNWVQNSGNRISEFLKNHPQVEQVFHVGDPDSEFRQLYDKQMSGSTGLLSFMPKNQDMDWVKRFIETLDIYQIGVSWGGFESLSVPIYMHPMDWSEPKWIIRLYCGLEDPQDLIHDLENAFRKLG